MRRFAVVLVFVGALCALVPYLGGPSPSRATRSAQASTRTLPIDRLDLSVLRLPAPLPTTTPPPSPAPAAVGSITAPGGDATSTLTPDWACIRTAESGGRYNSYAAPAGAYGITQPAWRLYGDGTWWPYLASPAAQDAAALAIYRANGDRFSGAFNDPCTRSGGGWLS